MILVFKYFQEAMCLQMESIISQLGTNEEEAKEQLLATLQSKQQLQYEQIITFLGEKVSRLLRIFLNAFFKCYEIWYFKLSTKFFIQIVLLVFKTV